MEEIMSEDTGKTGLILPPFNRRHFLRTTGVGLAGLGLFGLGAGSAHADIANAGAWGKYKDTALRLLLVNHWWTDAIKARLPDFEKLTGMSVTVDVLSEDNYFQKAAVELSSGTGNYDALMVGNLQAGQYMAAGWLAPLDDALGKSSIIDAGWYKLDDIFAAGRTAGTLNSQLMALPIGTEAEVLIYRKSLLDKAGIGPIRTFDDLVKAATVTNKDGVAGFVGRGRRGFDIAWVWLGYFLGLGGTVMKDGKSGVNSDAGRMASEIYLNKLLKANGPQGTANMSWLEASTVFKEGKAALYTDASGLLAVTIDKTSSKVSDDVGVYAWPSAGSSPMLPNYWFWLLGLPAAGHNLDAATLFLAWATSPEVSLDAGRKTGSPLARASVWADEGFKKFYPGDSAAEIAKTLAAVQPATVPYSHPRFPAVVDALSVELVNVLTGTKEVAAALADADGAMNQALGG
jgi:multiple sugar transport system substrate-binding protein